MNKLKITDVRILPGDSGFLIDDGTTAILYDSGFGCTGAKMADRICQELGNRPLDYIFLTHSHYDHALGSVEISKRYPGVQIVAGEYTQTIFNKASAKSVMQDLDSKVALQWGLDCRDDLTKELRVDIPVRDGDVLNCGDMRFTVVALPGHTRCSIGFYLEKEALLLATETLGVYVGKDTYLPSYLVSYQKTIEAFQRARALGAKRILIPHYGVAENGEAQRYLRAGEQTARLTAQRIQSQLRLGLSHDEILEHLTGLLYLPNVSPVYPIDAFRLNTSIMIRLIENELFDEKS